MCPQCNCHLKTNPRQEPMSCARQTVHCVHASQVAERNTRQLTIEQMVTHSALTHTVALVNGLAITWPCQVNVLCTQHCYPIITNTIRPSWACTRPRVAVRLTHCLVLAADGGGVVEDKDVTLKLPAGLGVQCHGNQDHPLADLVPLVLHTYNGQSRQYLPEW